MFKAGDQVPVMLFSDVVGKGAKTPPEQIAATGLKVGVIKGPMVTDVVATMPGQPPLGATE